MAKDYSLFKGYSTNSVRYKTKRKDEQESKRINQVAVLKQIEKELLNFENLTEEEISVLEKRRDSLLKYCRVENNRDLTQDFIPFRLDSRTVIFIRKKNLFKPKWVSRIGRKRIEARLKEYENIKNKKPEGIIYWNPFLY